ncbi:phenylacetate--CoA ligase family protein [Chondromyces crocatus]|uniref:Phenylacetate--CoA ligase n=1 Tax=Chondromyces crocatus TaxID=52 RepID=A0A0K1EEK8_CHOCO|nr:phenylacetate--CoA ligase family protein [Chondromyces crocatus]AKT39289.1 phenylacetate--CoA ligase [Chondromyces crocatus]
MNKAQRQRTLAAFNHFFATPLDEALARHRDVDPAALALALFQEVAASVPAYGRFLTERGLQATTVQTPDAFRVLPVLTKQSYILQNPLDDLCRGGRLEDCDMVAVSSGSTGRPTFWPRFVTDELSVARRFEQVFHDAFEADRRRTLAVICFALGTWVGGMYTTAACRHLAAKGYPITVITPGNNKEEIFRAVLELGPAFDQVVLLGYPPFLKDIIDTGRVRGVDWTPFHLKLVFAGEVFSEEWRTLVLERAGATDPCRDSASLYGTADAGVLGNETPLSITIRRYLARHPDAARELFGQDRLPTLVQYDPCARYFEAIDGALVFTGDSGVPLVRYAILDQGGVIPHDTMLSFLARRSFHPLVSLGDARGLRDLPFAYVFGRADFTVSHFGANVYPENIAVGLEQPAVAEHVTGKFVMEVHEAEDHDTVLTIRVELAPGEEASDPLATSITTAIQTELLRLNSEYRNYVPPDRQTPRILLLPAGDPSYFPVGVKHRYTRKPTPPA